MYSAESLRSVYAEALQCRHVFYCSIVELKSTSLLIVDISLKSLIIHLSSIATSYEQLVTRQALLGDAGPAGALSDTLNKSSRLRAAHAELVGPHATHSTTTHPLSPAASHTFSSRDGTLSLSC
ncbi:hypothetical protein K469DRAFT_764675 [Zopfia rhizophila CBS 207.26]|uniref:Uncharacterized protein n=1 Tax=Zopfia rhizophila CBS 207.26 TaxID=1314779 RepID=A0A6A6EFI8_9PEZI|nr:hypothetical protein K469DRAFT_692535 [Zopfia rhizophila CBS 207.26]KAF2175950.1 hypothetical protein K469DRAFT_683328 [Zopfia rhizophila CBS 207.26]KAF2177000.1 hypothetical protein K469DRAFT_697554 [Zopfia rhizophila CBS 207.26]KAF2177713.1 hypothetical protein K469DRAFT_696478 [Zopfia rhizophila CBS 207.26]KAF2181239.1 hypothetical protein K469DRAFT_692118 [Zopfia rhizophila CBS 207.26]